MNLISFKMIIRKTKVFSLCVLKLLLHNRNLDENALPCIIILSLLSRLHRLLKDIDIMYYITFQATLDFVKRNNKTERNMFQWIRNMFQSNPTCKQTSSSPTYAMGIRWTWSASPILSFYLLLIRKFEVQGQDWKGNVLRR